MKNTLIINYNDAKRLKVNLIYIRYFIKNEFSLKKTSGINFSFDLECMTLEEIFEKENFLIDL